MQDWDVALYVQNDLMGQPFDEPVLILVPFPVT
jgi:hypothetical protein